MSATILLVLASGCAEPGSDGPPGTFTEIFERYFPPETVARCNFCHSMPPSDISNGNLTTGMDQDAAYAALVGTTSTSSRCNGKQIVVPHAPEESLLLDKLMAKPSCGDRMPLGGMAFSADEIDMVRSWIEAGAAND